MLIFTWKMEKFTWKCVKALILKYFVLVYTNLHSQSIGRIRIRNPANRFSLDVHGSGSGLGSGSLYSYTMFTLITTKLVCGTIPSHDEQQATKPNDKALEQQKILNGRQNSIKFCLQQVCRAVGITRTTNSMFTCRTTEQSICILCRTINYEYAVKKKKTTVTAESNITCHIVSMH